MGKGGYFLKKLWYCVGGGVKHEDLVYQRSGQCKLPTVQELKMLTFQALDLILVTYVVMLQLRT